MPKAAPNIATHRLGPAEPKPAPKDRQTACNELLMLLKNCGNKVFSEKKMFCSLLPPEHVENKEASPAVEPGKPQEFPSIPKENPREPKNPAAPIVLVDARKGLLPQSRRHAFIASLLGIPHVAA